MKKNIGFIALIAAVLAMTVMLAPKPAYTTVTMPTNTLYTATISTFSATDAGAAADINLATVKVKCISISNTTATAQTITIYTLGNSTTTIKAVYVMTIPATIGLYEVPGFKNISNTSTNSDLTNIPYFTIRTSTTSGNAATVNVTYWQ